MQKDFKIIKEFALGEVYTQSAPMVPITIMGGAKSLINVKKNTRLKYKGFLFEFSKDYGSIFYQINDLNKIGDEIWKKIEKDKNFLKKTRKVHDSEQASSLKFYDKVKKTHLSKISYSKLLVYIRRAVKAVQDGVGTGHLIEAFSLTADERIKTSLISYIKDEHVCSQVYAELTTPEEESFLSVAHKLLQQISKNPQNRSLVNKFYKNFYWIRTSYADKENVDDGFVVKEGVVKQNNIWSLDRIKAKKKQLIKKYKLPKWLVAEINFVAFMGAWQDERKKYGLMGVYHVLYLIDELSRRTGISAKYLKYVMPKELEKVRGMEGGLKQRFEHSFYVVDYKDSYVVTKESAKEIALLMKKEINQEETVTGTIASPGKVVGKARVCTDLSSLEKVEEGDILVASMTRPEYMSAMKKASAFVTDEGGITCHAAIVAREMRKPCIIGTKIATKVLKDGDLVEVDANKGMVNILKS